MNLSRHTARARVGVRVYARAAPRSRHFVSNHQAHHQLTGSQNRLAGLCLQGQGLERRLGAMVREMRMLARVCCRFAREEGRL
jgi:hypothetical protein